ncbi:MAG: L,D-transpeptidase/peptidoglycan binding protein [Clostridiales Family XIII bacterium]|jgi:lipoprotein-anchoring transpeptidase ErfK/SrfK|nr:L,D-transpeptidase/peptidoglycan binding protein [Clostridiales Family XIII bacterium]
MEIKSKKNKIIKIAFVSILIFILLILAAFWSKYSDKIAPRTYLGSEDVSGMTAEQFKDQAIASLDRATCTFQFNSSSTTVSPSAIGLDLNLQDTIDGAVGFDSFKDYFAKLNFKDHRKIDLKISYDKKKVSSSLRDTFANDFSPPKEPEIHYSENQSTFTVTPGSSGTTISDESIERVCNKLIAKLSKVELDENQSYPIDTQEVEPSISESEANIVCDKANAILDSSYVLTLDGVEVSTLSRATKATFFTIAPGKENGTLKIVPNDEKILSYIHDTIAKSVSITMVDKKVVMQNTTELEVLQEGKDGRTLKDIDTICKTIHDAIVDGTSLLYELPVTKTPFTITKLDQPRERWIDVDLSEQITRLYYDNNAIAEYVISSGLPNTPTITGTFHVYLQVPVQNLSGNNFYHPDVKWCTWFSGDFGFHTAYWHDNFGTPQSHGCINMKENEAKAVYDFATDGMRVVVHK